MHPECAELMHFVRGATDAAAFPHREHVRMAFEMLRRHDFAESVWLYSRALRAMTARAGRPEAFNQTVTIAFLSLVAERIPAPSGDFETFAVEHPELFAKGALARWYPRERLASELTRRIFVMPSPACAESEVRPAAPAPANS